MSTTKHIVEKITARVFCQKHGAGGNPVTIFSCPTTSLSEATQQRLAQTCAWESVMLNEKERKMSFFMPTGEAVSFCAHAAMGGAMQMKRQSSFSTIVEEPFSFQADMQPDQSYQTILHEHGIVSLDMQAIFEEQQVQHPPQLQRILRDALNLQAPELVQPPAMLSQSSVPRFPTFVNSSVARPKTLVFVNDQETLNTIKAPTASDPFRIACDALQSTGLYLYAFCSVEDMNENELLIECRQFPRASGYPEDPATGIAAAALALSLYQRGLRRQYYKFQQGTAMGKPSLILVENIQCLSADGDTDPNEAGMRVSFRLTGKVEVDDREEIEISGED